MTSKQPIFIKGLHDLTQERLEHNRELWRNYPVDIAGFPLTMEQAFWKGVNEIASRVVNDAPTLSNAYTKILILKTLNENLATFYDLFSVWPMAVPIWRVASPQAREIAALSSTTQEYPILRFEAGDDAAAKVDGIYNGFTLRTAFYFGPFPTMIPRFGSYNSIN